MFPNTITIYSHSSQNLKDIYTRQVVSGVYWYGSVGMSSANKGVENVSDVKIVTSPETTAEYSKSWTVRNGDRIVKGEHGDIASFKDLNGEQVITVTSVAEHICGSEVDNITIGGK